MENSKSQTFSLDYKNLTVYTDIGKEDEGNTERYDEIEPRQVTRKDLFSYDLCINCVFLVIPSMYTQSRSI